VRDAAGRGEDIHQAWRLLIERYREPVRRSVRRHMGNHPDADQVAEDFFAYLFEQGVLPRADPKMGRFRCFIQGVVRNYVRVLQRQGRRQMRERSAESMEEFLESPASGAVRFEQEEQADWARAVLENALAALRRRSPRDGLLLLQAYGIPPHARVSRAELGQEHELSPGALNVALHRARRELRVLLVAEIRRTVVSEEDFSEEQRLVYEHLLSAWPGLVDSDDGG